MALLVKDETTKCQISSQEMYLVSNELIEPGEFHIQTKVACLSGLVKKMIVEYGAVTDQFYKFTLKKVDRKTLRLVVEYLKFHSKDNINSHDCKNDSKLEFELHDCEDDGDWDEKFINGLDYVSLNLLKEASKYMEISSLYDLANLKSRSMVTLLPWNKNKGFNVTHEQCQVSQLLRSFIDKMQDNKRNKDDEKQNNHDHNKDSDDNYVFTMKQIDYETLELVADYLRRCNGKIPPKLSTLGDKFYANYSSKKVYNNNDDNDHGNQIISIEQLKSDAACLNQLMDESKAISDHEHNANPITPNMPDEFEILCKLVDFIVNVKDLKVLARLEIASDYLQMPSLANLAYMQACQLTLESYSTQDRDMKEVELCDNHQQPLILENFYSRFDTVTLEPSDNSKDVYIVTRKAASLLTSKLKKAFSSNNIRNYKLYKKSYRSM